jgi:hypothetical protein
LPYQLAIPVSSAPTRGVTGTRTDFFFAQEMASSGAAKRASARRREVSGRPSARLKRISSIKTILAVNVFAHFSPGNFRTKAGTPMHFSLDFFQEPIYI